MLYRLGHLVAAHPVVVLVFWIALAAGVTLTVKQVGANTENNEGLRDTGSHAAPDMSPTRTTSRRSPTPTTRARRSSTCTAPPVRSRRLPEPRSRRTRRPR